MLNPSGVGSSIYRRGCMDYVNIHHVGYAEKLRVAWVDFHTLDGCFCEVAPFIMQGQVWVHFGGLWRPAFDRVWPATTRLESFVDFVDSELGVRLLSLLGYGFSLKWGGVGLLFSSFQNMVGKVSTPCSSGSSSKYNSGESSRGSSSPLGGLTPFPQLGFLFVARLFIGHFLVFVVLGCKRIMIEG